MDPKLSTVPETSHLLRGYEPLPFIGDGAVASLKGGVIRSHPLSGYGYFADLPLPLCDIPILWIVNRSEEMADFKGVSVFMRPSFKGVLVRVF